MDFFFNWITSFRFIVSKLLLSTQSYFSNHTGPAAARAAAANTVRPTTTHHFISHIEYNRGLPSPFTYTILNRIARFIAKLIMNIITSPCLVNDGRLQLFTGIYSGQIDLKKYWLYRLFPSLEIDFYPTAELNFCFNWRKN